MNKLEAIPAWIEAHPVVTSLIILPALMAIVNFFLKPRTEEEYAEIAAESPRFASFLRLLRKLFPDPKGAYDALKGVLTRKGPPLAILLLCISAGVASVGCKPAQSPEDARASTRATLVMVARGVNAAADVCLETAREICDVDEDGRCQADEERTATARDLVKGCKAAYDTALGALSAADDALDAKTALDERNTACAASKGLDAIEAIAYALKPYANMPTIVTDAVAFARAFAERCTP